MNFFRTIFLFLFVFTNCSKAFAQFDTLYAIKYPSKIGLSIFQSKPSYQIYLSQKITSDSLGLSKINYTTLAKNVTGFGFFYDKISLFVGFQSPLEKDEKEKKGKTRYSQFGLAITGVKIRVEGSLRTYKGFYDVNSVKYISNFNDSTPYYQNGEMSNHSWRIKAFFFTSKKKRFSYGAAYVNNVRQLKSAGSFILATNLYSFRLKSTSLVPAAINQYYGNWNQWNQFEVTALTAGIGYTHTITIFKRAFINLLFTLGLEEQHIVMKSEATNQNVDLWRSQVSAYDWRSSIGYNTKSFFISLQNIIDGNSYQLNLFDVSNIYINTFLNIGYRFPVRTPGFYKSIQGTKVYKTI